MNQLNVKLMGRGTTCLDTGTHDSLTEASGLIAALQNRQGQYIFYLEEIADLQKWIDAEQLKHLTAPLHKKNCGRYI